MVDQEEIYNLCLSKDPKKRIKAIRQLQNDFSLLSDKQQAWNDLHKLVTNEVTGVRSSAVSALTAVFSEVPDKQQAWNDLVILASNEDRNVRYCVTPTLSSVFSYVPYKQLAWVDLVPLTFDNDYFVSSRASFALKVLFSDVPDKQQAWSDLIRLTSSRDSDVSSSTISTFGSIFSQVPDKLQAWNDLVRSIYNKDRFVRYWVIAIFSSVFSYIPDKQHAWNDLHRLTSDDDGSVRSRVASLLGSVFSDIPDKEQAWNDLVRLSSDKNSYVKIHSNHSLGKVSIINASLAGNNGEYKKELEKAIGFFETAAKESSYNNPAQFCLPFYRSFHTILFKSAEAKETVDKYLAEAKNAIEGSKSKELLIEAVENLANALNEVQNLKNLDFEAKKSELNFYKKYCDRATELMRNTEESAPLATITMRKGLPILDRNLRGLLEEIQEKAKTTCHESQGTPTQGIACAVNREVQKWEIGSQEEMTFNVSKVVMVLKSKIPHTLENKEILDMIESMKYEKDLTRQYGILPIIIGLIPTVNVVQVEPVLDEIKELRSAVDGLTASINELQNPQEYLDVILQDLIEIRDYMPKMKGQIENILSELHTPLSTTQKLKIAIPIIPSIVTYEQETDMPEFVAENIHELKNLLHKMKNSLKKLY